MLTTQIPTINPAEFSRCEENNQIIDHRKSLSPGQKTDVALKGSIERALWNDDVLRAIEYHDIDTHVKNGVVYLYGHIVNTSSKSRIENALRSIPRILGIQNHLVLDDKLTLDVAGSLGELEQIYDCKFFTGASHGVISLNGNVKEEHVKSLAEKCAASNPNVRGVINNVRVSGAEQEAPAQPFRQPTIGERIYFLDGVSGVVKQVIINPDNRRVIAMTVRGQFADERQDIESLNNGDSQTPERLVVVPMTEVRHLTTVSGFLSIPSTERNRYMDFDSTRLFTPKEGWKAPHPYCPVDVLFPIEQREVEYPILEHLPGPPLAVASQEQVLWEQLLAEQNLGG
jgi:osmotically-inducible protein OsmY